MAPRDSTNGKKELFKNHGRMQEGSTPRLQENACWLQLRRGTPGMTGQCMVENSEVMHGL